MLLLWETGQDYDFIRIEVGINISQNDTRQIDTNNINPVHNNISLVTIFLTFFKIGAFTFGGGYVMIPLIQREIEDNKKWLQRGEFYDILALIQGLPGPVALNCAIMISRKLRGIIGGLVASVALILPSIIIILTIVVYLLPLISGNYYMEAVFYGIRPAVTALVAVGVWNMGKELLRDKFSAILFIVLISMGIFLQAHPVYLLLLGGLIGWLYFNRKEDDE